MMLVAVAAAFVSGRIKPLIEQVYAESVFPSITSRLLLIILHCFVSDHFIAYTASTIIRANGRQNIFLCRRICEEKKAQLLNLLLSS